MQRLNFYASAIFLIGCLGSMNGAQAHTKMTPEVHDEVGHNPPILGVDFVLQQKQSDGSFKTLSENEVFVKEDSLAITAENQLMGYVDKDGIKKKDLGETHWALLKNSVEIVVSEEKSSIKDHSILDFSFVYQTIEGYKLQNAHDKAEHSEEPKIVKIAFEKIFDRSFAKANHFTDDDFDLCVATWDAQKDMVSPTKNPCAIAAGEPPNKPTVPTEPTP